MSESEEGGITASRRRLYDLLPAIYRRADEAEGYPLLALMQVFEHVFADLEAGLPALEEGWFIETCAADRVPAIAAMVGARLSHPLRPEHRARVADALALRRRVGLASALPRLIRGASGWYALVSTDLTTPAAAWPLPDLTQAGTTLPRTIGQDAPRRVGSLRVWRLRVLYACGTTPGAGATPGRFTFDPLGYERPLWTVAGSALPMAAAPPVTALPAAVGRAMLAADLARTRRDWPEGSDAKASGPEDSLLYGPARGLAICAWTPGQDGKTGGSGAWRTIPPSEISVGILSDGAAVPPDYPALVSGPIDPKSFAPGAPVLTVDLCDARAEVALDLAPGMAMPALAAAFAQALAKPRRIVREGTTPWAASGLTVGALGDRLAIVPQDGSAALSFATAAPDPLALAGAVTRVGALCTVPIDPAMARRLTQAAPGRVLAFSGTGRAFAIPLPLATTAAEPDSEAIAATVQAALPDCFICTAAGRTVIVPPPNAVAADTTAEPDSSGLARDLGLVPTLVIDPEAGRFAWPAAWGSPPRLAVDPVDTSPAFDPANRYPLPGFARLSDENPPALLSGATDRDVVGAGNRAAPTARARDFEDALRENLLFGTGLGVVFES